MSCGTSARPGSIIITTTEQPFFFLIETNAGDTNRSSSTSGGGGGRAAWVAVEASATALWDSDGGRQNQHRIRGSSRKRGHIVESAGALAH